LKQQNLCEHAKNCLIPVYKFQNPTVKLVYTRNNYFTPVHIIEHKQKFYSFNSLLNPEFNPFLIKCNPTTKISFAGEEISLDLIENVLRSKPVKKQFSIVLYSAFSLVKSTSNTKQMAKLLLGFFNAQTENPSILYLFIIPHLENSTFTIVQIFQKYKTPLLNPKTIFHTIKNFMLKICLFFTASNSAQKNFLYENLGMYTQSLYKKYKTNVLFCL